MESYIRSSLEIKRAIIEADEFDKGPRNILNYGHSFGHAMESATDFAIPHGIAVSIGMDMANFVGGPAGHYGGERLRTHLSDSSREFFDFGKNGDTPGQILSLSRKIRKTPTLNSGSLCPIKMLKLKRACVPTTRVPERLRAVPGVRTVVHENPAR